MNNVSTGFAALVIDISRKIQNDRQVNGDPHAKSTLGPLWLWIPDKGG